MGSSLIGGQPGHTTTLQAFAWTQGRNLLKDSDKKDVKKGKRRTPSAARVNFFFWSHTCVRCCLQGPSSSFVRIHLRICSTTGNAPVPLSLWQQITPPTRCRVPAPNGIRVWHPSTLATRAHTFFRLRLELNRCNGKKYC
jgi:hypothetical protein